MAKKSAKTEARLSSPKPNSDRSVNAYPVEKVELEFEQARLKTAAAVGKRALKSPSTMKVEFPPGSSTSRSLLPLVLPKSTKKTVPLKPPARAMEVEIVNVSFTLVRPGARQVSLCGEFNGWSPEAGPMTRHEDGLWEALVALRPGRYEYKFLVDGEWLADPVVRQTVPNGYGSVNSVIEVFEIVTSGR